MSINTYKYHKIWNNNNPNDLIQKGDGYVIHHKDFNHDNDNPNNLEKIKDFDHRSLHNRKENHPLYGKKGEDHHFYGGKHTNKTKQKMSIKQKCENNPNSKLTQMTVDWGRDILDSDEYKEVFKKGLINQSKLAKLFGINKITIGRIKNNKTWRKDD